MRQHGGIKMQTFTTEQLSEVVRIDTSLLNKMTRCTKVTITGKLIAVYERKDKNSMWYNKTEVEKTLQKLAELKNQLKRVRKNA